MRPASAGDWVGSGDDLSKGTAARTWTEFRTIGTAT